MRFRIALTLIGVLAAAPADAQTALPTPAPGLPVRTMNTYTVRSTIATPFMQIVVQGHATLRVPAEGVRIDAYVSGVADGADREAVLTRLRGGGLETPQILSPSNFGLNNQPSIVRALLRRPTQQRLEALGRLTAAILAEHPNLKLQNANLTPFIDDCQSYESKLRHQAIDDARRRAADIAQAASVTLGSVTSVNELGSVCAAATPGAPFFNGGGGALESEPTVSLSMNESVTFALVPSVPMQAR